jgi:hypothetical protein
MPIIDVPTYNALSNVLQTTFGKSSDQRSKFVPHTHFLSMSIIADNLIKINYMTVVNYGHEQVRMDLRQMHLNEGLEVMRAVLKKAAEEYKDYVENVIKAHSGLQKRPYTSINNALDEKPIAKDNGLPQDTISLKLLENTISDTYEITNVNAYNSRKSAYFRMSAVAKVK